MRRGRRGTQWAGGTVRSGLGLFGKWVAGFECNVQKIMRCSCRHGWTASFEWFACFEWVAGFEWAAGFECNVKKDVRCSLQVRVGCMLRMG